MKTLKTFLAVIFATFIVNVAMASGNLKVNLSSVDNELTAVEISNVKMSTFEIEVEDINGETVFQKKTKAPASTYKRTYDFSKLEDGVYYFNVKIDNELTETKFNIVRGELTVLEEKKSLDPIFIFDNKQLKLSYLNFAGDKSTLTVYDNLGNEVYVKDLKSEFVTNHGLDFSNTRNGKYQVVLTSGYNYHTYNVHLD